MPATFSDLQKALERFDVLLSNVHVVGDDWQAPSDDSDAETKIGYLQRVVDHVNAESSVRLPSDTPRPSSKKACKTSTDGWTSAPACP